MGTFFDVEKAVLLLAKLGKKTATRIIKESPAVLSAMGKKPVHAMSEKNQNYVSIRYHATIVFQLFENGELVLRTGGWPSNTTKKRINQAFACLGLPLAVFQSNFVWSVYNFQTGKDTTWGNMKGNMPHYSNDVFCLNLAESLFQEFPFQRFIDYKLERKANKESEKKDCIINSQITAKIEAEKITNQEKYHNAFVRDLQKNTKALNND